MPEDPTDRRDPVRNRDMAISKGVAAANAAATLRNAMIKHAEHADDPGEQRALALVLDLVTNLGRGLIHAQLAVHDAIHDVADAGHIGAITRPDPARQMDAIELLVKARESLAESDEQTEQLRDLASDPLATHAQVAAIRALYASRAVEDLAGAVAAILGIPTPADLGVSEGDERPTLRSV